MFEHFHVLIVDDDQEIRSVLSDYLGKHGFRTTSAADGREMRRVMGRGRIDLIVLDLMLPGEDGLSICRNLQHAQSQVPIIMVSARGEEIDRILGLELGADDYLPKPFNPRELLGRIRAVLRRASHIAREPDPQSVRSFSFDRWRLDTAQRTLISDTGREVLLTGGEYRLLAVLLSSGNRTFSRAQLTSILRGRHSEIFDRSIDVRISRLRQILGDDARSPRIIKTVYGEGYVIGVPIVAN